MGDIWVMTWHADSGAAIGDAQSAAVTWAQTLWKAVSGIDGYQTLTTSGVSLTSVSTGLLDIATGLQQQLAEDDESLPGTATGNALPGDSAIVVSLRTVLANRRGRGRFYLPQPAASTLAADGRLSTAAITTLLSALGEAWSLYTTSGTPVVYSRTNRSTQPITSYNVGNLYDSQRRRENGVTEVRTSATMP